MLRSNTVTRRRFLSSSTRTAAALGIGSVLAGRTASAAVRKIGANDRITIGLIGSGGQGTHDARTTCVAENVVCAALSDVAEFRLAGAGNAVRKAMESKAHKDIKIDTYPDFRKLLDRRDIDAVIIATPDHWHMAAFVAALDAGKHVYQEKPMSKSIEQGNQMLAAAKKHPDLTVQIGTQRRSGLQYPKAKAAIDDGMIGEVTFARCFDCRNWVTGGDPFAPKPISGKLDWDRFQEPCEHKVDFEPHRYWAWRWFWDYANGLVADVGVHVLDVVHWLTGRDTPKTVVCNGGVYGLKYWETPDVVNAVWDYGTHSVVFTANFTNGFEGSGLTIYGTKGTMEIVADDIRVWPEGKREKPLAEFKAENQVHQHNWIDCIRSGKQPNAPVELGVRSLLPLHLANMAYRQGRRITWDADARKAS